jgi:hypothetical protein
MVDYDPAQSTHHREKNAGTGAQTNPTSQIAQVIQQPLSVNCARPPDQSAQTNIHNQYFGAQVTPSNQPSVSCPPLAIPHHLHQQPRIVSPHTSMPSQSAQSQHQDFVAMYSAQVTPANQPSLTVSCPPLAMPHHLHQHSSIISPENNNRATTPFAQVNPQNQASGASKLAKGTVSGKGKESSLLLNDCSKENRFGEKMAELLEGKLFHYSFDNNQVLISSNSPIYDQFISCIAIEKLVSTLLRPIYSRN